MSLQELIEIFAKWSKTEIDELLTYLQSYEIIQ